MAHPEFTSRFFTCPDGLKLHYRDYPANHSDAPVVVCLAGLTRNARDFEPVAEQFAGRVHLLCPDQRGRGLSDYDPDTARYRPDVYVTDMLALLEHNDIKRAHFIGTSLGGIMTMLIAAHRPDLIASAVLNDIGPTIDQTGIDRIKAYVGTPSPAIETWKEAARRAKEMAGHVYPHFTDTDWDRFARRIFRKTHGLIRPDYDPGIGEAFKGDDTAAAPDLWPLFPALRPVPLLVLRGETSDLLSPETVERMAAEHPDCTTVTVPGVGHTPTLEEDESRSALMNFAARFY